MGNIKVKIYERVKLDGEWTRRPVAVPDRRKRDGRLFVHQNRQGKFQISWYENRKKKWQDVTNPASEELPYLSDAVKSAEDKAFAEAAELQCKSVGGQIVEQRFFQTPDNAVHDVLGFVLCGQCQCLPNPRNQLVSTA